MSTVYNWDLHDLGCSTFQSIQAQALRAEQAKVLDSNIRALDASARNAPAAEQAQLMAAADKLRESMADLGVDQSQIPAPSAPQTAPATSAANTGIVASFMALSVGQKAAVGLGVLGLGWVGCRLWRNRSED